MTPSPLSRTLQTRRRLFGVGWTNRVARLAGHAGFIHLFRLPLSHELMQTLVLNSLRMRLRRLEPQLHICYMTPMVGRRTLYVLLCSPNESVPEKLFGAEGQWLRTAHLLGLEGHALPAPADRHHPSRRRRPPVAVQLSAASHSACVRALSQMKRSQAKGQKWCMSSYCHAKCHTMPMDARFAEHCLPHPFIFVPVPADCSHNLLHRGRVPLAAVITMSRYCMTAGAASAPRIRMNARIRPSFGRTAVAASAPKLENKIIAAVGRNIMLCVLSSMLSSIPCRSGIESAASAYITVIILNLADGSMSVHLTTTHSIARQKISFTAVLDTKLSTVLSAIVVVSYERFTSVAT